MGQCNVRFYGGPADGRWERFNAVAGDVRRLIGCAPVSPDGGPLSLVTHTYHVHELRGRGWRVYICRHEDMEIEDVIKNYKKQ